jgi:hypothetical protein
MLDEVRKCKKCLQYKAISEFHKMGSDFRPRCKPCHINDAKEWAKKNPEKYAQKLAKLREKTASKPKKKRLTREEKLLKKREYNKIWSEKNKDRFIQMRKDWFLRNKHVEMERVRRRQAAQKKAVPKWASKEAMQSFYDAAIKETKATGEKWSVDHIVPLKSPLVCGLHCEYNMQIMRFSDNSKKGNRHWPDMPT